MSIVFDFKHYFHKWINRVDFLVSEIISSFKSQFIDSAVGFARGKKITDSAVAIRHPFAMRVHEIPSASCRKRIIGTPGAGVPRLTSSIWVLSWYFSTGVDLEAANVQKQIPAMQVARIRCFRIVILQCFVPARFSPCFSWQILSCRRFCYGLPISWRTKTLFELSDGLISSIPDFILESPRSQNNVSAFFLNSILNKKIHLKMQNIP